MQMREMLGKKDATYFRFSTIRPMITDEIIAPIDAGFIRSPKHYIISVFNVALIHFYSNLRGCLFNMISCCFCKFT